MKKKYLVTTVAMLYYLCIFYLLRRKKLALKYTLLWLVMGLVMLVIVIFPNAFTKLVNVVGVIEMTNGLFAVVLFAIIIILISITSIVSKLNDQIRQLVQKCALYEKHIRSLEEELQKMKEQK